MLIIFMYRDFGSVYIFFSPCVKSKSILNHASMGFSHFCVLMPSVKSKTPSLSSERQVMVMVA